MDKQKLFEYYELIENASTKKEKIKYINEALQLYPDDLDLLLYKANDLNTQRHQNDYIDNLENIIKIGDKQMSDGNYFKNSMGLFWNDIDTRPYMTVRYNYFLALMKNGFYTKAINEGKYLLELCTNDNLGVRYSLMFLYAFVEDKESAKKLFNLYSEDISTHFLLAKCFLYYKIGEIEKAEEILLSIKNLNKDLLEFSKIITRFNTNIQLFDQNIIAYQLNSFSELILIYNNYSNLFYSCPLFFKWIKNKLTNKKSK